MGCCVTLELNNLALSEYINYDFNSFCLYKGECYGASSDGIFVLDDGGTDVGSDIASVFKSGLLDFGLENPKTLRAAVVEFESTDDLVLTVEPDEGVPDSKTLVSDLVSNHQQGKAVFFSREHAGGRWSFQIENVRGGDFSVDKIVFYFNALAVKHLPRSARATGNIVFPEVTVIASPYVPGILDFPEITISATGEQDLN
jgi:hypothetical protein